LERRSGYINPNRLRRQVRARLPELGVEVVAEPVRRLCPAPEAGNQCAFNNAYRRWQIPDCIDATLVEATLGDWAAWLDPPHSARYSLVSS
jgi:hypothetical protein